jgi:hypothetical protein
MAMILWIEQQPGQNQQLAYHQSQDEHAPNRKDDWHKW